MNLDILNCEQGTVDWHKARHGVITASRAGDAISGKTTATRSSYMSELIAQIATGEILEIKAWTMEWGKQQEPLARSAYEFVRGVPVEEAGFIYGHNRRVGCSPDGLILNQGKGLEIKCPATSKVHVDFLLMEKVKAEYIHQVQFSLWVTGLETWDFCSFDDRMKKHSLKVITIEKDYKAFDRFDNDVNEFIRDMDIQLNRLEISWGSQWA